MQGGPYRQHAPEMPLQLNPDDGNSFIYISWLHNLATMIDFDYPVYPKVFQLMALANNFNPQ
jgi:hypothetical protein